MFKKLVLGAGALLALLLIVIATRPDTFRVERTTTIAAPASVVFNYVNDFHQWEKWNPFNEPGQKLTISGAPAGVGAVYEYEAKQAGSGRMEILESRANEYVKIKLDFIKPMAATNTAEYVLKPTADGVALSWIMTGESNFLSKAITMVMDFDAIMGDLFNKGLADIKRLSEEEHARLQEEAKKAEAAAQAVAPVAPATK